MGGTPAEARRRQDLALPLPSGVRDAAVRDPAGNLIRIQELR